MLSGNNRGIPDEENPEYTCHAPGILSRNEDFYFSANYFFQLTQKDGYSQYRNTHHFIRQLRVQAAIEKLRRTQFEEIYIPAPIGGERRPLSLKHTWLNRWLFLAFVAWYENLDYLTSALQFCLKSYPGESDLDNARRMYIYRRVVNVRTGGKLYFKRLEKAIWHVISTF